MPSLPAVRRRDDARAVWIAVMLTPSKFFRLKNHPFHRGHGRSDAPAGMAGHHMSWYVDDVIAVLDHAGISRAAMVGYSLGARVAYAVAATLPERLSGVVGLDSVSRPGRAAR